METTTNGRITAALQLIDEWISPQGPPGVGAAVWHQGDIVAERYAGEARPGAPVSAETIFALASVTKPVTAAAVMTLIEEGLVSLDEPVGRIVPEFRSGPDTRANDVHSELERLRPTITTRQLLAHTSGLPEDLGPRDSRYADQVDIETLIDAMCALPLQSPPGAELRYSNAGYAVLARLVSRVTGEPFWDVVRQRVLDPLELDDTVATPDQSLASQIIHLADSNHEGSDVETYNSDYWRRLALPWGGLFGTARDLARFAGTFLPGGPRLLSPASVNMMTTDQAGGVPGGVESARVRWDVARWGLGWEVKGHKRRHWTGELTSPATFCHFGHAGTLLWADPARDVALAVFTNRAVTHMWSFILARWQRISNAVVAATSASEPHHGQ